MTSWLTAVPPWVVLLGWLGWAAFWLALGIRVERRRLGRILRRLGTLDPAAQAKAACEISRIAEGR